MEGRITVTKEYKYYIGAGDGNNQEFDERGIASWGSKFAPEAAKFYFNEFERN